MATWWSSASTCESQIRARGVGGLRILVHEGRDFRESSRGLLTPMIVAGTIVARNYLAQAQVLVDSFRDHHPDGEFYVLVVDDLETQAPKVPGAEVLMLDQIG